jgi:hypothetical protein
MYALRPDLSLTFLRGSLLRQDDLSQTAPPGWVLHLAAAVPGFDFGSNAGRNRGPVGPLNLLANHAFRHAEAITEWNRILRLFEPNPHPDMVLPELAPVAGVYTTGQSAVAQNR